MKTKYDAPSGDLWRKEKIPSRNAMKLDEAKEDAWEDLEGSRTEPNDLEDLEKLLKGIIPQPVDGTCPDRERRQT
jgi:hypothetical protein